MLESNFEEKKISKFLLLIIFTIPFPITIRFMGNDAISLTTVLIFLYAAYSFIESFFIRKDHSLNAVTWILISIIIAYSLSLFNLTPSLLMPGIRRYIFLINGPILFFVIVKEFNNTKKLKYLINLIILMISLQAIIGIIQYYSPAFNEVLQIFSPRDTFAGIGISDRNIHRIEGTINDYELLAEWFLLGIILSYSKIREHKSNLLPLLAIILLIIGIIFTVTRSAFFLFPLSLLLYAFLSNKKIKIKIFVYLICILLITVIVVFNPLFEKIGPLNDAFTRINNTVDVVNSLDPSISEITNRSSIWETYPGLLDFSFFGYGPISPTYLLFSYTNFHSFYLSTYFQIGAVGIATYLIFFIFLIRRLIVKFIYNRNNTINNKFIITSLVILIIFLLDQYKIEFVRHSQTVQFAWMILALVYSSTIIPMDSESTEEVSISE